MIDGIKTARMKRDAVAPIPFGSKLLPILGKGGLDKAKCVQGASTRFATVLRAGAELPSVTDEKQLQVKKLEPKKTPPVLVEKFAASLEVPDPLGLLKLSQQPNGRASASEKKAVPSNSDLQADFTLTTAAQIKGKVAKPVKPLSEVAPAEPAQSKTASHLIGLPLPLAGKKAEAMSKVEPGPALANVPQLSLPELTAKLGAQLKQRIVAGDPTMEVMIVSPVIGRLKIELEERDGKMTATFHTDSAALREILERDRAELVKQIPTFDGTPPEVVIDFQTAGNQNTDSNTSSSNANGAESSSPLARFLNHSQVEPERQTRSIYATREWIG